MFGDLIAKLLAAEAPDPAPVDDQAALAALLVRAARADEDYAAVERAMIERVLAERFSLSTADAAALCREGEAIEARAPDNVTLTRAVKHSVPYEERVEVAEALWRVVLADEKRDAEENAFLRLVVSLIGVNDRDSGLARQRAERG